MVPYYYPRFDGSEGTGSTRKQEEQEADHRVPAAVGCPRFTVLRPVDPGLGLDPSPTRQHGSTSRAGRDLRVQRCRGLCGQARGAPENIHRRLA